MLTFGSMRRILRQFLLALIAFAMVGGTTTQLARSAAFVVPVTMTGVPCDMMAPTAGAEHGKPMTPCKSMTPDCLKQMRCVADVGLPVRFASHEAAVRFSAITYWNIRSEAAGLIRAPEPLPPRTS
jgi:hypothetical protein